MSTHSAAVQGIIAGTGIMTARGRVAVENLRPGERVVTRSGIRVLRAVTVEEMAAATLVEVAAGALGHDRPGQVLRLPADQPVLLRDWRAEALYNQAQALVPAARLADGEFVRLVRVAGVRLFRLAFDGAEVVYADGVELTCAPALVAA